MRARRSPSEAQVRLVAFDLPDRERLMHGLVADLGEILRVEVEIWAPQDARERPSAALARFQDCYDQVRGQYDAHCLLAHLRGLAEDGVVLGVTSVDLYAPVFKFVVGEGVLGGRTAVISTYRLAEELYGLPPRPDLLRARLSKEAIHELGHCRGLVHCFEPDCFMRAASSVEEIDLRGFALCAACAQSWAAR